MGRGSGIDRHGRDFSSILGQMYILKEPPRKSMQIKQLKQITHFDGASNCDSQWDKGATAGQETPMHTPFKFCNKIKGKSNGGCLPAR